MNILLYGFFFYYISATIGLSTGYHRYFSHRSFSASPVAEVIMLFFGLICGGRSALTWVAVHRMHHAHTDTDSDPHSPKFKGAANVLLSRWRVPYIPKKFIKDLLKNPRLVFFHRYGKYIHLIYALLLFAISVDALLIFAVMPFVFSYIGFGVLNYVAHRKGQATNVPWTNIIAPGEGWHENHHKHPRNYRLHRLDYVGYIIEKLFIKSKSSS